MNEMLPVLIEFCNKINLAAEKYHVGHRLSEQPECMHWARELVSYINEFSPVPFDSWIISYQPPPRHPDDPDVLELRKTILRLEEENARLRAQRGRPQLEDDQVYALRDDVETARHAIAAIAQHVDRLWLT